MNKSRKPRTNYNILKYEFSCSHYCANWHWKKCKECRSRNKCKKHIRHVYRSEEGIYYPTERFEISPKHAEDLGTYVHEFTEHYIIQVLRRYRINWHKSVTFKKDNINRTYVVHVISPYGANNGTCIDPSTHRNRPKW